MKLAVKNHIAAGAVIGLALIGSWGIASPALAVTNPADNPRPITVKGDDGKTYTDGQDTLPGFDDEECTYIPGAYFDFDNNRVYYADGQSIPWTEWDRTAGYQDWLKKKNSGSSGSGSGSGSGSSSGSGTKTPSKSSGSGTKSSSGTSGSSKSGSSSSSASGAGGTAGTSASGTAASGSSSTTKKSEKGTSKTKSTKDDTAVDTTATDAAATDDTVAASTPETTEAAGTQANAGGPSPLLGVGILGGLAAAGGLAWGGIALRRRAAEKAN